MRKSGRDSQGTFSASKSSGSMGVFITLGIIVLVFALWSIWAIRSEKSHRKIALLYANAFVLYDKVDFSKPYNVEQQPLLTQTLEAMEKVLAYPDRYSEWYLACAQTGFLYNYEENDKKALEYLEKIPEAPRSFLIKARAMVVLARLYLKENDVKRAVAVYRSLETQTKGNILDFVRYQLGILYASQKKTNSAMDMYQKISPDSSLRPLAEDNMILLQTTAKS